MDIQFRITRFWLNRKYSGLIAKLKFQIYQLKKKFYQKSNIFFRRQFIFFFFSVKKKDKESFNEYD